MPATVIFSSNDNPLYSDFVEPVTKAWQNLGFEVHAEILTDVKCFVPHEEIPAGNQAQMIRAILPALYPEKVFLLSDVDMLPLNSTYFQKAVELLNDNEIVNVSADAYPGQLRLPICYFIGKGSTFSRVTGVNTVDDISAVMRRWWSQGHGWASDEICFTAELAESVKSGKVRFTGYARGWTQGRAHHRIDRDIWVYDRDALSAGAYLDSHMLRPLTSNIEHLAPLFQSVGVDL